MVVFIEMAIINECRFFSCGFAYFLDQFIDAINHIKLFNELTFFDILICLMTYFTSTNSQLFMQKNSDYY